MTKPISEDAEDELARCRFEYEAMRLDSLSARAELARCRPVVDAALAWDETALYLSVVAYRAGEPQ